MRGISNYSLICTGALSLALSCCGNFGPDNTSELGAAHSKKRGTCIDYKRARWNIMVMSVLFPDDIENKYKDDDYFVRIPQIASTGMMSGEEYGYDTDLGQGRSGYVVQFDQHGTYGRMSDRNDPRDVNVKNVTLRYFSAQEINDASFELVRVDRLVELDNPLGGGEIKGLDFANKDHVTRCGKGLGPALTEETLFYEWLYACNEDSTSPVDSAHCSVPVPQSLFGWCQASNGQVIIYYRIYTADTLCRPADPSRPMAET